MSRKGGDLVDAGPAMEHIRSLRRKGMSMSRIHEVSGISPRSLAGFLRGTVRDRGRDREVKRCSPEMMADVLAIEFDPEWVPEGFRPDLLRGLRESRGISRAALGASVGLNPSTIQYWENGRSRPVRRRNLEMVLNALNASWEDVSGPVEPEAEDEFTVQFPVDPDADYVPDYPCLVCRQTFRSRHLLATHPHPKKKVLT